MTKYCFRYIDTKYYVMIHNRTTHNNRYVMIYADSKKEAWLECLYYYIDKSADEFIDPDVSCVETREEMIECYGEEEVNKIDKSMINYQFPNRK